MDTVLSEAYYKGVPAEQRERLYAFRASHPCKEIEISGNRWSYLLSGQGAETLVILPGGERIGDMGFPLMQHLEPEYRCLYPSYPALPKIGSIVDGLAALLDQLSIGKVMLLAGSFGGAVGQCFVRRHPERVSKLILLNTGFPDKRLGKAAQLVKPIVRLFPLGLVRAMLTAAASKALSVQPEEKLFWRAMLRELFDHLSRADMVSAFDETTDYRLNYAFSPDDLSNWPGEVLILQSDDDPATKPAMRRILRDLYQRARLHKFHHAGHTPFLSQPEEFYPRVRTFLIGGK